jgi:hypothetical protein
MSALQGYRELTYRLAGDLQTIADIAGRRGNTALAEEAHEVRQRIEARRFTLAVVGEFKRGKSTFINALLGAEILPADVLPTSATVNRVTFGLTPTATLYFRDGRPPEQVPIASLADHVTKLTEASAARAATVREAVVAYPLALCRHDVDLVDTPGLSDEQQMTDVTVGVLPTIDAAILVLMADSPFSTSEAALVERLVQQGVGHLLFVVTAIDRIRKEEDRQRVVQAVRDRLRATGLVGDDPSVFPVSGRWALDGRVEGDVPLFERSGFPALEEGLQRDLLRSDGVALMRRLHQLQEQCQRLLEDGEARRLQVTGPPPARARLVALLEATDSALTRTSRRWEEAGDQLLEALGPRLEAWPKAVNLAANVVVSRHKAKVVPGWLDRREAVLAEMVGEIEAAVHQKLQEELVPATEGLAEVLSSAQAELEQAAVALQIVLSSVARTVSAPPPPPGLVDGLRQSVSLQPTEAEWAVLRPSRELLLESVDLPELATLGKGAEKLDFLSKTMAGYNLPGQFAKLATNGLALRLTRHWDTWPPRRWLEDWWAARATPITRTLEATRLSVRSLQGAVEAWSERQVVQQERDQREIVLEANRLVEIRERAGRVLEELRWAGFSGGYGESGIGHGAWGMGHENEAGGLGLKGPGP